MREVADGVVGHSVKNGDVALAGRRHRLVGLRISADQEVLP
jgi:hypothetical protein